MARDQKSGRGPGRGRGSGRGFYRFRSKSSNQDNKTTKIEHKTSKLEMKFAPQGQGKAQATFATVKEHLQHHLQLKLDKGDDVVISIESMELLDLNALYPVRKQSKKKDAADNAFEQKGLDYLHEQEIKKYVDRVENFQANLRNTFTVIYQHYCTEGMKAMLDRDPTFVTVLKKNLIALLAAIRKYMQDAVRMQLYTISIKDSINRVFNIAQFENEHLNDFIKRFKQHKDTLEAQIGTKLLDQYYESTSEYVALTEAKKKALKTEGWNFMMATIVIEASDDAKFGTLKKDLRSQFSRNNDQYPVDIGHCYETTVIEDLSSVYQTWHRRKLQ